MDSLRLLGEHFIEWLVIFCYGMLPIVVVFIVTVLSLALALASVCYLASSLGLSSYFLN
jgi:hypothetical protein